MEVASCLASRASSVTVVGMEKVPFERVLGEQVGSFMKRLHEANGVVFKVRQNLSSFVDTVLTLLFSWKQPPPSSK